MHTCSDRLPAIRLYGPLPGLREACDIAALEIISVACANGLEDANEDYGSFVDCAKRVMHELLGANESTLEAIMSSLLPWQQNTLNELLKKAQGCGR